MSRPAPIRLLGGYGVELEYMIVDRPALSVMPIADQLLRDSMGRPRNQLRRGPLAWSNELAAHLVELKTARPARSLRGIERIFHAGVREINRRLKMFDATLMPTAAHPWMNPSRECRLWPHGDSEIYRAFDDVFDCRGHGWVNLQSCHLNLPFHTSEEFGRLHAAIRLVLPLLPALAAASPFLDGRRTGWLDTRLREYRRNCRRIPSVTGPLVPERVFTPRDYRRDILARMYRDITPLDPRGVLRHEWLNARGAIARFERNTIEIRVLDVQECPLADIAILDFVAAALKALVQERWSDLARQQSVGTGFLADLLEQAARIGSKARIPRPGYAALFGRPRTATLRDLLEGLFESLEEDCAPEHRRAMSAILECGCLAERIVRECGAHRGRPQNLPDVYRELCACLEQNRLFLP